MPAKFLLRITLAGVLSFTAVAARTAHAEATASTIPMLTLLHAAPRLAAPPSIAASRSFAGATPGQQCRQAIRAAERAGGIPDQLMAAIGRVESGRREADGTVNPWPWSINAEGQDHIYETKTQAVAAVRALQAHGMRSIDVGCMQVNLMYHPDAFATLEQAFDPATNAAYAARFLTQLRQQTGTWPIATAWYHSATPELGADYQRKVMAVWPEEKKHREDVVRTDLASAWGATHAAAIPPTSGSIGGGFVLARRGDMGRIIPQATGTIGRGLAAYRAMPVARPIPLATTPATRGPLVRQVSDRS